MGEACERLAFPQTSDAGRKLFLVDLVTGTGCPGVAQVPRQIAGK